MKRLFSKSDEDDNEFTMNGANLVGHRNPPPPPAPKFRQPKTITYKTQWMTNLNIKFEHSTQSDFSDLARAESE